VTKVTLKSLMCFSDIRKCSHKSVTLKSLVTLLFYEYETSQEYIKISKDFSQIVYAENVCMRYYLLVPANNIMLISVYSTFHLSD